MGRLDDYISNRSKPKLFHAFRMEEIVCDTQEIPDAIYRLVLT